MIQVISKTLDYKTGLTGSEVLTGTALKYGAYQGFICQTYTVVAIVTNSKGDDITDLLGLRGVTLSPGIYICVPKGESIYSISLASGSVVLYGIAANIERVPTIAEIIDAFSSRVTTDGGTLESTSCINGSLVPYYKDASFVLIPSGYKALKAYAQKPITGNGDLTWTRGSDAFRTNASGVIQRVPWNLLQYSEQFNNAFHFPFNLNAFGSGSVANTTATVDPNGSNFADYIQENTSASVQHSIIDIFSGNVSGTTYTWSVFAKAAQRTIIQLANNGGGGGQANYNLTTGVASLNNGVSASMQDVGNGWYRCILSYTSTTTGNHNVQIRLCDASGNSTYTGNGTSGVYIWGAQLVEGTTAQTYLPTTDRLNFPRLSYMYGSCPALLLEPQRTNSIRNSTMQGAVAGSPGTLPTNWTITTGVTQTIVGFGVENGLPYLDVRFNGTASTSLILLSSESTSGIAASNGQTWTNSFYFKVIASPLPPTSYNVHTVQRASGTNIGSFNLPFTPTSTLARYTQTVTTNQATITHIQPFFFASATIGQTYDFTIRIAAPQMELGAYATTWIDTTNAAATRLADSFTRNNIYTNGLISASGGTWFVELRNNVAYTRDNGLNNIILSNSGVDTYIRLRNDGSVNSTLLIQTAVSGIISTHGALGTANVKFAIKWNGTTADVFVNGVKTVASTSFVATQLEILSCSPQVPNFIQAMALYPTPLSDATCIAMTQ